MNAKKFRVLVVDDEEDIRELLVSEFQEQGIEAHEALGGHKAWEMLRNQEYDLVISDVRMPEGNGIELLEKVTALKEKAVPVVLMTGYSGISEEEALQKGALKVFNKPFSFDEFIERAKAFLSSGKKDAFDD